MDLGHTECRALTRDSCVLHVVRLKVEIKWKKALLTLLGHILGHIVRLFNNIKIQTIFVFLCIFILKSNHILFL